MVLVDKVNSIMGEGRFLSARGEWGDPRRFKRNIHFRDLGELPPRVALDLLYRAVATADEQYQGALRRAGDARQRDLDHLARGFTQ